MFVRTGTLLNISGTAPVVYLANRSPGFRLTNLLVVVVMVLSIAWPTAARAQDGGNEINETGIVVSTPDLVNQVMPESVVRCCAGTQSR